MFNIYFSWIALRVWELITYVEEYKIVPVWNFFCFVSGIILRKCSFDSDSNHKHFKIVIIWKRYRIVILLKNALIKWRYFFFPELSETIKEYCIHFIFIFYFFLIIVRNTYRFSWKKILAWESTILFNGKKEKKKKTFLLKY